MSLHFGIGLGIGHMTRGLSWIRALLLEGGTDRILLEGDATDGNDFLLIEGTT